MGKVTITVDDLSPQIKYVGTWRRDQALGAIDIYFQRSTIGTKTPGDTATFSFNGTSIAVYGAKKSDHGTFSVKLDDNPPLSATGMIPTPPLGTAQLELFRVDNLDPNQPHQIVLTNTQAAWFDIDYIVYETLVGGQDDEVITTIVDDAAGVFVLNPPDTRANPGGSNAWQTQHDANKQCFNTTRTATTIKDYTVTVPFNGSSVQVFGGISVIHGMYGVSIDGGEQQAYNGSTIQAAGYNGRRQIFGATGLQDGPHEIVFSNLEDKWFDIDYAVVNSTRRAVDTADSSDSSGSTPTGAGKKSTPVAAITASVVSVVVLAAVALGLFFFLRRRRRVNREEQGNLVDMSSIDGDDGPASFHAGAAASKPSTAGSSAPQLIDLAPTPFTFPSSSTSLSQGPNNSVLAVPMPRSPAPSGSFVSHQQQPSDVVSPSRHTTTTDAFNRFDSTASATDYLTPRPSRAGPVPAGPGSPPARQSSPSEGGGSNAERRAIKAGYVAALPPTSVGGERMNVFGREQDAGPMEHGDEGDHGATMLPPDYHQAIQPIERR